MADPFRAIYKSLISRMFDFQMVKAMVAPLKPLWQPTM